MGFCKTGEKQKEIFVTCRAADSLPVDRLLDFQSGLKKISKQNLTKLKSRILKHGINAPVFVWDYKGDYYILDGHQRIKALCSLREDGYSLPLIPVAYIEANNISDAKDKLLGITSQYGEFDLDGIAEFTADLELDADLRLVDTELKLASADPNPTEGDDEVPEQASSITHPGDLWELGGGA